MCFFNILFFKCEVQERILYFSGSKTPAAWIPWKSENALWRECNLPLTFSAQCSLICLLPLYFQPHWKCLKVPLDNACEPKWAELLEDGQNGLQKIKSCTWVFKKAWERLFSSRAGLQFGFDDGFPARIYVCVLRIHFCQVSTSEYSTTCKFRIEYIFWKVVSWLIFPWVKLL